MTIKEKKAEFVEAYGELVPDLKDHAFLSRKLPSLWKRAAQARYDLTLAIDQKAGNRLDEKRQVLTDKDAELLNYLQTHGESGDGVLWSFWLESGLYDVEDKDIVESNTVSKVIKQICQKLERMGLIKYRDWDRLSMWSLIHRIDTEG